MKRKLAAIVSVASLLACLAAATAWAVSYRPTASAAFSVPFWRTHSSRGTLWVSHNCFVPFASGGGWPIIPIEHSPIPGLHFRTATISGELGPGITTIEVLHEYGADYWLIVALTLLAPAVWLIRRVRHRNTNASERCRSCRYSLTGNTSGVCPECGTHVSSAPDAPAR
jgi:hypothetical protein